MAQPSLLDQYAAVTVVPAVLRHLLQKMKPCNSHSLLSFMVGNLPTAVLGKRYYNERLVRMTMPLWWELDCRAGLRREVPSFNVDSAIVAVNAKLKEWSLPYRVGRRCHNGNPRSIKFEPVAPYVIGLVDISRPLELKPKLLSGSRAV